MDSRIAQAASQAQVRAPAILVRFFRVRPGEEQAAADSLVQRLPTAMVFRVFGAADFAVVESLRDWSSAAPIANTSDRFHAIDVMPLRCFSWGEEGDWRSFVQEAAGLVAFSFVKIKEEHVRKAGILAEMEVVAKLGRLARDHDRSGLRVFVLGTLGWHELLVMVAGRDLGAIQSYVLQMRSGFGLSAHPVPEVDSTTTVIGLRSPEGVRTETSFGPVKVALHVSCAPEGDALVYRELERAFGEGAIWTFGINDFLKEIGGGLDPAIYVDRLADFRRRNSSWVYRTVSLLGGKPPGEAGRGQVSARRIMGLPFPMPTAEAPRVAQLRRENSALAEMLVDVYATLASYSLDGQIWQAFEDVWPYAERLRDTVVKGDPNKPLGRLALHVCLDLLSYGIHQRAVGTGVFWEREVATFPYPNRFGGVHRLLVALGAVPDFILRRSGREWSGFMVVGFTGDFRRYEGAVLNVPWEALKDNASWLSLAHEAGHEFACMVDLIGGEHMQKAAIKAGLWDDPLDLYLIVEVFCQIYGCLFAAGSEHWDAYLDASWDYIRQQPASSQPLRVISIFRRYLLADLFFVWKRRVEERGGKVRFLPKRVLDERARIVASILQAGPEVPNLDWKRETRRAVRLARRVTRAGLFEALDQHLHDLPDYKPDLELETRLAEGFRSGRLVLGAEGNGAEIDPITILRATLGGDAKKGWSERVASLLSLWHYAKTRQPAPPAVQGT